MPPVEGVNYRFLALWLPNRAEYGAGRFISCAGLNIRFWIRRQPRPIFNPQHSRPLARSADYPRDKLAMRKLVSVLATVGVVSGMLLATPIVSASAISSGVQFSADNLPAWQTNGLVYAVGQANGRVVAGGEFSQLRPPNGGTGTVRNVRSLAIFDAETGAPDSCQLQALLAGGTPSVRAITTSPDGNTVYVGGSFSSIGGVSVNRIAAIDPVACTVKPFRVAAVSGPVYTIAVTENTVYFGGQFTTVASQPRQRFAAVNSTTGALLPWVADVELPGRAVTVSPDRTKVAIGGDFFTVNGQASHSIGVVDAVTGTNVRNYPVGFIHRNSVTKSLSSDATSFYGGNEGTGGGVFDGTFSIDWNTLNERWRNTCLGATQAVLPYEGTLYSANHHHDCASNNNAFADGKRIYFTANKTDDPTLLGWFPAANDGTGEGIGPRALVVATGKTTGKKYLWAGGEFTVINGAAQQGLTRFSTTDTGAPPAPEVAAEALTSGAVQVRFRTVVDPDDSLLTYNVYRNAAATPIWTGTASSMWWVRPQVTFVDTTAVPGTTYTYRVSASDGINVSGLSGTASARAVTKTIDYAGQVVADGPSLYWRYDEQAGVWAQDKSGPTTTGLNGLYQNGLLRNAAGAVPGASTAAQLDGVNDYALSDQMRPGPTSYTIETWFNTNTTRGGKIIGYGNGRPKTHTGAYVASSSYDRHVYMEDSGRINFGVYVGNAQTIRTPLAYNDSKWHHLVATQGPAGLALYIDGVQVGTNSTTTAQPYQGTWRVGGDNLNGWPNRPSSSFFAGAIDETAVYDRALTINQVARHYQLGGGTVVTKEPPADAYGAAVFNSNPDLYWRLDETSGAVAADSSFLGQRNGSIGSQVQLQQPAVVNGGFAVRTTGSADSVVASPEGGSTAAFSTEAWFKTDTTAGGKLTGYENAATGSGSNYDKQVYMTNAGNLIFGVYAGGFQTVTTPGTYNDNVWHHVVAVQDSSGMKLYVDAVLTGTNATAVNQAFTGYWRAGGGNLNSWPQQPSNGYFTGDLDEVAIYPNGLSAGEVSSHYSLGINDTTPPTVPQEVQATLVAGDTQVNWAASTDNNAVAGYQVHRGAAESFPVSAATKVADVTATTWTDPAVPAGTWYYKIVAVDTAGNASAASAAASVTVAAPPDVEAPSVPAGLAASASGTSVALTWSAATDNVAVTGYQVYRGSSAGFVAEPSSKIADATGTNYSDSGLAPGTWYYRVASRDAAGNVSGASESVEATVSPTPVEPVVLTAYPTGDAMVYRTSPTTNYGSDSQLSSRGAGGNSPIESYLAFNLPAAPVGMVLSGATIRLRTSGDPSAGSVDSHTLRLVTGAWTESTVNWNNRPTGDGAALGTVTGATATHTPYTITLNAAELSGLAGSTQSIALFSSGLDNLRLWSNNAPSATYRPLLTLTYTAP